MATQTFAGRNIKERITAVPEALQINIGFYYDDQCVELLSVDGLLNEYRKSITISPDRKTLIYEGNIDTDVWDETGATDTFSYRLRDKDSGEETTANITLEKWANEDGYFIPDVLVPLLPGSHDFIQIDLKDITGFSFDITEIGYYQKNFLKDVKVAPENKYSLILVFNSDCFKSINNPPETKFTFLGRDTETGNTALSVVKIRIANPNLFQPPFIEIVVADPLPANVIVDIATYEPRTTGLYASYPVPALFGSAAIVGTKVIYTFNTEDEYWTKSVYDIVGYIAYNAAEEAGVNYIKIKKRSLETPLVETDSTYNVLYGQITVIAALTGTMDYPAPFSAEGQLVIMVDHTTLVGIEFSGVVARLNSTTLTIVPDDISTSDFSLPALFLDLPIITGTLRFNDETLIADAIINIVGGEINT